MIAIFAGVIALALPRAAVLCSWPVTANEVSHYSEPAPAVFDPKAQTVILAVSIGRALSGQGCWSPEKHLMFWIHVAIVPRANNSKVARFAAVEDRPKNRYKIHGAWAVIIKILTLNRSPIAATQH